MASASNSITIYSNNGSGYTLTASFTENGQPNVVNNTTNITCTATLSSGNPNWSTSYASSLIIYWHDNRENYDRQVGSISFAGMGANTSKSASGTINVVHNSDGNLSGYAYAVFNKGSTTSVWAPNTNGVTTSWTALTKIDRYATVTGASNFTDMQNPSFTYSNPRNLDMSLWLEINPNGEHLCQRTITNSTGGTYTWELTEVERNQLRSQIPNSKTGVCRIGAYSTISGTTNASYKDVTFTIVEEAPTMDVSYKDTNSTTGNITLNNQLIIRNNSTLQIDVENANAYKMATLSNVQVELNGEIYTSSIQHPGGSATFNIGTINVSDNITAVVTLTDSRGFKGIQNLNIRVLDWQLPTAIINLQRENNFYSETNINVNAEYSSLDNKNEITIKVRNKKVSDTTYSSYTTLQDDVTTQLTLDNNYAWDVQVLVQDLLGSTTYNLSLDRGIPITFFDRSKRSVGINCFPTNDTSLEISGKTIADIIYPVGSIYLSVNNTDPSTLFGGTWVQIKDQFLLSAGDTYTGGSTGGSASHNHLTAMGFDENSLYGYSTNQGGEYLPAYNSTVLYNKNFISSPITKHTGNLRLAYTDNSSSLPPYLVVYVWKRTA